MKNLIKLIASFFYLGYVPFIPGTVASCAGLALYFIFRDNFYLYTGVLVIVGSLGFLVSGRAERILQQKDPKCVVIDEVAGLLLAFWALKLDLLLIILGFLIFRLLDAIKAFPANRLEKLNGSAGIMADDLIAGAYTNIILQLVTRVFPYLW